MRTFLPFLLLLLSPRTQAQPADPLAALAAAEQRSFSLLQGAGRSVSSNNYDVHFYRCRWQVDPAVRYIKGSVSMHFRATEALSSLTLDLARELRVDSVGFRGGRVDFVQTANNGLQLNLPAQLSAGQGDSVHIFYEGVPPETGFGSFNLAQHAGVPILWTLSEPYGARTWWPCKDALTDKADSIDIELSVPSTYVSSSNGLPVREVTEGATRTTYWQHRYPIASYLVAIAVTNYTVEQESVTIGSRSMPVALYAYPESLPGFRAATNTARLALQQFSDLVGEYPFIRERYAQTQFSWGGGMEHQTNSFITTANSGLVAHELAHQWFGNKVTCGSWQDLWLNEGFATYFEHIYVELNNPGLRLNQLQGWRNNITANPGGSVFIADTANINRLFNTRLTYLKAGYVVHMLRWKLGDSTFFRGLRRYLDDPALRYRTARTEDLHRVLEAESGQQLEEFFADWIYGEGHPNYAAEWAQTGSGQLRLRLGQTTTHQSVNFFEMPVQVLLRGSGRETLVTVTHQRNGQVFPLDPGFAVDTVIVDPELRILVNQKTSRRVSDITLPPGFTAYPNPTQGDFTLTLSGQGNARLRILNTLGQQVYTASYPAGTTQALIPANGWQAGVYYLWLTDSAGERLVQRVLVVRN